MIEVDTCLLHRSLQPSDPLYPNHLSGNKAVICTLVSPSHRLKPPSKHPQLATTNKQQLWSGGSPNQTPASCAAVEFSFRCLGQSVVCRDHITPSCRPAAATMATGQSEMLAKAEDFADKVEGVVGAWWGAWWRAWWSGWSGGGGG